MEEIAHEGASSPRPNHPNHVLELRPVAVYLASYLRRPDKRSVLVAVAAVGLVSVAIDGERGTVAIERAR